MIHNILLLTPVYPADDVHKSTTPVVHYFTREWVKMGYNVQVIHYPVNFPKFVYWMARPLKDTIGTKVGSEIRTWPLKEREYELEGVKVKRFPLVKIRPHSRYPMREIRRAQSKTIEYCKSIDFKPDVIICHWINPTLDLMCQLKQYFNVPICYIAHDAGNDLHSIYSNEAFAMLKSVDVIGYRSRSIKEEMERDYKLQSKPNFQCYSGIPKSFLADSKRVVEKVSSFIFVGTLLKRKYPAEIVPAVSSAYRNEMFDITYIGDGKESNNVKRYAKQFGVEKKVHLLGRIPREKVVGLLDDHDVFVMISRSETFGLVYLEAMARGCITIAAKNEGFDGIIEDGRNGFLCEAGNVEELTSIIMKLKSMSAADLTAISSAAMDTARKLTDVAVAENFIRTIENAIS
jgi:glycosyltransferase involved in cell wall biosynthesis